MQAAEPAPAPAAPATAATTTAAAAAVMKVSESEGKLEILLPAQNCTSKSSSSSGISSCRGVSSTKSWQYRGEGPSHLISLQLGGGQRWPMVAEKPRENCNAQRSCDHPRRTPAPGDDSRDVQDPRLKAASSEEDWPIAAGHNVGGTRSLACSPPPMDYYPLDF
ncbi:UNVERIFIED_CONTAM: hypothetical protein K2H54_022909 [Gekko kuhli]